MPISRNQMIKNARAFSQRWADETSEKAESQTFWNEFFAIFGINRREVALFEAGLKKLKGSQGFIDVFWKGKLICEQKSRGHDLNKAYHQALEYLQATAKVAKDDLPRYVITCDFEWLHLYDLEASTSEEQQVIIKVAELADKLHFFGFMTNDITQLRKDEEQVNIVAAEKMGKLHDGLKAIGYDGHDLEVMLIRLLFCLFAEDTQIFEKYQFENFLKNKTRADGSDLAPQLAHLFQILNTPKEKRLKNLDLDLAEFEYINGELFAEQLAMASFDEDLRSLLLDACKMDWSQISPEIFGALFQSVMDKDARRALGAHYTSEENILKVVNSLFMDDLRAEFELAKKGSSKQKRMEQLDKFHQKIANLDFLDPACGCGNFLIVAYRELRLLELQVIGELHKKAQFLDIETMIRCDVNQFYGIEIEEFPAQIARVAMWLIDHQMNRLISQHFGTHFARIPLKKSANIQCANALTTHWASVDYILGNPPFLGKNFQSKEQKQDLANIAKEIKKSASLDYVCAWYIKAVESLKANPALKVAFVSTNSITQGEQVPILWEYLLQQGVHIHFAHRTFAWTNEAKGVAAVHCVIIGFALTPATKPQLFSYADIKGEPEVSICKNIHPYLIDAPNILLEKSRNQISNEILMIYGTKPCDGGHLILMPQEKEQLIQTEPLAEQYIRPFLGADEFINGKTRYCLWFTDVDLVKLNQDLAKMPQVKQRIENVKQMRLASSSTTTQKDANIPHLFQQISQPKDGYFLAIPEVSSENRQFIPIDYLSHETILSNLCYSLPNASLYHFGILNSTMHNAFMRVTAGRLKSDYRYSNGLVYNNFPYPFTQAQRLSDDKTIAKHVAEIEKHAQAILDARAFYRQEAVQKGQAEPSLADFYRVNLIDIYPKLTQAHKNLDLAVDKAYRKEKFKDEAERVAFLFELYQHINGA